LSNFDSVKALKDELSVSVVCITVCMPACHLWCTS